MSNQKKLKAFSFFHLNIAYSAIGVERRKEVIEKCYWPLLKLARSRNLPFGIEASAWTLETIAEIDPSWLQELRDLVVNGPCEFIGCGYAQVIGPLVPAIVNEANLRIGMQRYEYLLGLKPKIALINEQAFSSGLVQLYKDAGYEALIMEWNNPARAHPEWPPEWRYLPQYACGSNGEELPIIWNESISFQKVQRYVHGEMELDEWMRYFESHKSETVRTFPIYGNDVEVFDFRPGRYMTEAPIEESEWQKIENMYAALETAKDIEMVLPSEVLQLLSEPGAGNKIELGTAAFPVPVKKQDKYNLLRWAVTGRDDLAINTACWQIYNTMRLSSAATLDDWRRLCYLWSSDFRTHITESRWKDYISLLQEVKKLWSVGDDGVIINRTAYGAKDNNDCYGGKINYARNGRYLDISWGSIRAVLNCNKGLALESLYNYEKNVEALCGTLHHGYFEDIGWAADFYSAHMSFQSLGNAKVTDLVKVEPKIQIEDNKLHIRCEIETRLGTIQKEWCFDGLANSIRLCYDINWNTEESGQFRLGFITLNSKAFDQKSLFYEVHNGGFLPEKYYINEKNFDHGDNVSLLISANQGLGMTERVISIGDDSNTITIRLPEDGVSAIGMVSNRTIKPSYLCRVVFSIEEVDDTSKPKKRTPHRFSMEIDP